MKTIIHDTEDLFEVQYQYDRPDGLFFLAIVQLEVVCDEGAWFVVESFHRSVFNERGTLLSEQKMDETLFFPASDEPTRDDAVNEVRNRKVDDWFYKCFEKGLFEW